MSSASELSDDLIAAHIELGARMPATTCAVHRCTMDGAVQAVPSDATALGTRNARYVVTMAGMWPDPAENEANAARVRDHHAAIAPDDHVPTTSGWPRSSAATTHHRPLTKLTPDR